MFYTVRETALKLGIPSSKIRFYDKKGLLPFIERSPNGVRIFTEDDVAHLQDLLVLKDSGFSLKELAEYVKLEAGQLYGAWKCWSSVITRWDQKLPGCKVFWRYWRSSGRAVSLCWNIRPICR